MNTRLTTAERLQVLRDERNLTYEELEAALHHKISSSSLCSYEDTSKDKDISSFALKTLADFYNVSIDWILERTDCRLPQNDEIQRLHLTDKMLSLLSEQKFNHRLFEEIVMHSNFQKLMSDIEIFVDGHVLSGLAEIHAKVDIARQEILKKYPGTDDLTTRTLEQAHISGRRYLYDIIEDDLECIISDIREKHKNDPYLSPDRDYSELKKAFVDEIMKYHDIDEINYDEEIAKMCLGYMKINRSKVSDNDIKGFMNVISKSPDFQKMQKSQRGKNSRKKKNRLH